MKGNKRLTIDFLSKLLFKKGLIGAPERQEIRIKGETHRAMLHKEFDRERGPSPVSVIVTPAEIIASFDFDLPSKPGKKLTEDVITEAIAEETGIAYLKIDPLKLNLEIVTANISRPFAQKHLMVPVGKEGGVIVLAVADPFDEEGVESLAQSTRMSYRRVLSSKSDIVKIVREFYGFRSSMVAAQKEMTGGNELGNLEQYVRLKGESEIEATDQHVVNAVEYLLHYAYDQRASDIHIEPKRITSLVRMRIDGILHNIHKIPGVVHPSIVSRIKMLARMDIAEKRRPQDGRIKTEYRGKEIELRISTLPTAFGEKVVIRVFDPDILCHSLKELGFEKRDLKLFSSFLKSPHGIILVTGPTGSGKTTTLYSALKAVSSPKVNIVTIEDPIEMVMEEFNQVGVQPQAGIDFAGCLRTILRQDPDIIMVGEIRDRETAENAVQAALTGHLVLSTLHTNDAPSAINRLIDLGVPPFLISSTLLGVMAQRLVRKVCTNCTSKRTLTPGEIDSLGLKKGEYLISYGEGCSECRNTGYRGRTGIYEIMPVTDGLRALFTGKIDTDTILKMAIEDGLVSLKKSGILKLYNGITTPEEIISVTGK